MEYDTQGYKGESNKNLYFVCFSFLQISQNLIPKSFPYMSFMFFSLSVQILQRKNNQFDSNPLI